MVFAPLLEWRWVKVTDRPTLRDGALLTWELVDAVFPGKKLVLAMDDLSTCTPSSRYETFEPAKARFVLERLGIHDTPKHGSRLNIEEIETCVLS